MGLPLSWRMRHRLRRWGRDARLAAGVFVIALAGGAMALLIEPGASAGSRATPAPLAAPTRQPPPRPTVATRQTEPRSRSLRAIDGDTLADEDTGERIRLSQIDTAEIGDGARCVAELRHGLAAKARVQALLLRAERVEVRSTGRVDRYGRTLARVLADRRDLGQTLIEEGLARPWRGAREPWCADDGSLLG